MVAEVSLPVVEVATEVSLLVVEGVAVEEAFLPEVEVDLVDVEEVDLVGVEVVDVEVEDLVAVEVEDLVDEEAVAVGEEVVA